jgi:outer membrane receptor protein involved in Fe transport
LFCCIYAQSADRPLSPAPDPNSRIQLVQKDDQPKKEPETPPRPEGPSRSDQPTRSDQPVRSDQPTRSDQPLGTPGQTPGAGPSSAAEAIFGSAGGSTPTPTALGGNVGAGQATSVGGGQAIGLATTDVGDLLSRSPSSPSVEVQRRNPSTTDPHIRGYRYPQILSFADGAFWFPARLDLDTVVSKIDSSQIRNVNVIRGPYSVRYGPGFAFLDIETLGTERYADGWEGHGQSYLIYKTNGDQWRGRQNFWGGSTDWGVRVGYDLMAGVDYTSGSGVQIPASYNSQNLDFAFGYDFSPDSRLELRILRQDLHDTEFPGQVFDINQLISDGYAARYTLKNQEYFGLLAVDGWYNETRLNGDDFRPSKLRQIPQLAQVGLLGVTDADLQSAGFRAAVTWGEDKCTQVTLGVDTRYLSQKLNEFDNITQQGGTFNNAIPRSHWYNPGVFLDTVVPVTECLTVRGGVRFDYADVNIDRLPPGVVQPFGPTTAPNDTVTRMERIYGAPAFEWHNDYRMISGFLSGEYKLNEHLTPYANLGVGNRPPSLTELYSLLPFLTVVQNGLNSVVGNPRLSPELGWQIEVGMRADYERFRGGFSLFYAWIHNYITWEVIDAETGGFDTLRYVNTDLATLSGFEVYGEYDALCWLTPFTSVGFVEGRDQTRDLRGSLVVQNTEPPFQGVPQASRQPEEPLPGIPPMDFRLGLRFHEPYRDNPKWGLELTARMVLTQQRVAASLYELPTPGFNTYFLRAFWKPNEHWLLTAGVENFLDRNYREHLDPLTGTVPAISNGMVGAVGPGVLQPGINFYFGAQLTY